MPKPKCVSGTICMKWNCASAKMFAAVPGSVFPATVQRQLFSLHTTVFIHTNRRSMISGILSARHTGSLAFWLQKIFKLSNRTRALPQVLHHTKLYYLLIFYAGCTLLRQHRSIGFLLTKRFHVKQVKLLVQENRLPFHFQQKKNVQAQLLYLNAFI